MTRIGQRIAAEIQRIAKDRPKGYPVKDLGNKLRVTFEQTRRYIRGEQIPPNDQLARICRALDIPFDEALCLVELDQMQRLMKQSPISDYPDLQVLCMLWPKLTSAERMHLARTAHSFIKSDKKMAAAG